MRVIIKVNLAFFLFLYFGLCLGNDVVNNKVDVEGSHMVFVGNDQKGAEINYDNRSFSTIVNDVLVNYEGFSEQERLEIIKSIEVLIRMSTKLREEEEARGEFIKEAVDYFTSLAGHIPTIRSKIEKISEINEINNSDELYRYISRKIMISTEFRYNIKNEDGMDKHLVTSYLMSLADSAVFKKEYLNISREAFIEEARAIYGYDNVAKLSIEYLAKIEKDFYWTLKSAVMMFEVLKLVESPAPGFESYHEGIVSRSIDFDDFMRDKHPLDYLGIKGYNIFNDNEVAYYSSVLKSLEYHFPSNYTKDGGPYRFDDSRYLRYSSSSYETQNKICAAFGILPSTSFYFPNWGELWEMCISGYILLAFLPTENDKRENEVARYFSEDFEEGSSLHEYFRHYYYYSDYGEDIFIEYYNFYQRLWGLPVTSYVNKTTNCFIMDDAFCLREVVTEPLGVHLDFDLFISDLKRGGISEDVSYSASPIVGCVL
ncbi:hypothetical protein [Pseudoalteromonas rubra]|uniref:Uncharacterized protein n=1 Tax=Pseudoalteromonas rubra TaxID=43658 RepID=A0A0F4QK88_9GAMM|nr:hypothetical protein [Pseudoalteromonas rubra]KJZ07072.1 hypothetical protein TW77_16430 [Pseudoalteromonas rubra]